MIQRLKRRWRLHQEMLIYTASNVTLAAASFLGSFICARLLLPHELGAFQTSMLLVTYMGFLPLGTFNGFNQQYPYLLGKGNLQNATTLARIGFSVARVTGGVAAFFGIGQLIFFWKTSHDQALIWAAISVIPVAALTQINALQSAILTGRQSFRWISRSQIVIASVTIVFLPLVWKFTVAGQCIRLVAVSIAGWAMLRVKTSEARYWCWDFKTIRNLIRIGIPILAIGYLYQVFSIADRTLVAWVKGTEAVGHYALAGLAIAAIQSVYTPLAVATYSKANHAYGRSHSIVPLIHSMKRFLILITVSVVPIAAFIYFTLPVAIPWLLPKYVAGIRAGQIACIASVAFCYCGTGFIYNVTGHNLIYGVLMGCAVAAFFLIGFLIPANELTLERVAWLRTGITVCLCVVSNIYLAFYMRYEIKHEPRCK